MAWYCCMTGVCCASVISARSLLAGARLLAVERVADHEPGAADLAIDAQEVAREARLSAAVLRVHDYDERAALIREVAGNDGLLRRPGLVDVGGLERARHRVDERLLADERRAARGDHHVLFGRQPRAS